MLSPWFSMIEWFVGHDSAYFSAGFAIRVLQLCKWTVDGPFMMFPYDFSHRISRRFLFSANRQLSGGQLGAQFIVSVDDVQLSLFWERFSRNALIWNAIEKFLSRLEQNSVCQVSLTITYHRRTTEVGETPTTWLLAARMEKGVVGRIKEWERWETVPLAV